jgi:hypothetical protein
MDSIYNIMNQNRHLLDDAEPPEGHFDRFQAKLKNQSISVQPKQNSWIYAAASIAILVSVSFWAVSVFNSPMVQQQFSATNGEIHDLDRYYQGQLENRMQALKSIKTEEYSVEGDVKHEIQEMESTRQLLINNYQKNPGNERILNEIVNNYRLQLEMLNDVISMQTGSKNNLKL